MTKDEVLELAVAAAADPEVETLLVVAIQSHVSHLRMSAFKLFPLLKALAAVSKLALEQSDGPSGVMTSARYGEEH